MNAFAQIDRAPTVLRRLLRPSLLGSWVEEWSWRRFLFCLGCIFVGGALFGAAMGWWRSGLQAFYTALKIPLVILLTTVGNGLLNAMLAPLLGSNLNVRQSLMAILLSFAIASVLLGAFAPLAAFAVWNTPPLDENTLLSSAGYGFLQLCQVLFITSAGITGHVALLPLLRQRSKSAAAARNVLLAWLSGNLLLGSQICWVLRPFIWDPARPVEFVGPEALRGSFYETVLLALIRLVS